MTQNIFDNDIFFKEYMEQLYLYAVAFVKDRAAAEDIVQDFFVKLWEKPYSVLFPETLKSYLFTSIRNLALNQLDKIDPLRQACDVAYYDSPWKEYDNFEDQVFRRVEEELEKLTPRAQEVIRSIYLEGMKYKDVADKLGISVATVNSILVRALKKLRQQADNKDELAVYLFFLEKSLISEQ